MNLCLTEQQEKIRRLVQQFAQKEVDPFVTEMEENDQFPKKIVTRLGELGLMGIPVAKRYGGLGEDFTSLIIAINELSRVSATIGVILSVHTSLAIQPILSFGTEEQKESYVVKLANGKQLGAFSLTEASAGSDAGNIRMTAAKRDDYYILNGTKMFVTNGGQADIYIVFALTDRAAKSDGMTAFIVDKNIPGLTVGKREKKMGLRGSHTTELIFENAIVPLKNRLGAEGEGFKVALANLASGRIGIAAQALGIAEAALAATIAYMKEKKHASTDQGVAFQLANMATKVEAAKLLVYRAANLKSKGLRCREAASMAKLFASRTAVEVTNSALEIVGHIGSTKNHPLERFFRDAKITEIYEGTSEIQRLVISRALMQ